jgi:4-amino-4-deoxy-L-arabinose transferase-like glycosyltransferase
VLQAGFSARAEFRQCIAGQRFNVRFLKWAEWGQIMMSKIGPNKRISDGFAKSHTALALLWLAWLLPRAAILLLHVTPTSDAEWYYSRANALAQGLGYLGSAGQPTAFWPPGWPMALSLVFRLMGTSLLSLGLFNLVCGALGAWLTLDIGRRLFGSELAGRIGLLLLALYPNNIGYYPLALTEVFYTTLLLAGCWLMIVRSSNVALVAAGIVFGVATLVKAQTLVVVPFILAIGLLREPGFWRRLPGAGFKLGMILAVAALVVLPWTIRNHQQLGAWVAISTNGGFTLLTGNNDSARGNYTPDDPVIKALDRRTELNEVQSDAEAKRLGIAWIKANPGAFAKLVPMKLLQLWMLDGDAMWAYEGGSPAFASYPAAFWAVRYANQAYYTALLLGFLAAGALMICRRAGKRWLDWWLLPYGIAAYVSTIAIVFSGQPRFHYPVMPFICMACGWLLADWFVDRNRGNSAP